MKVLEALQFLVDYSEVYADVEIDETALDWMEGEEDYLEGHDILVDNEVKIAEEEERLKIIDNGPAPRQVMEPQENGDNVEVYGYVDESGIGQLSEEDQEICIGLKEAVFQCTNKKDIVMDWPTVSEKAVCEFGETKIFAMAFPWLFPGGIGDVKEFEGPMDDWGKMMLYYEDGRFAKDKIFCFFALNYITRHRNASSGQYFVNNFHANCPKDLEDLKDDIKSGNTSFVNNLTYYSKRITGSSEYWRQKRGEVYTWINSHVQLGHGVPTFFITLSCAEFYWPDIIDLVKERMDLAGDDSSDCYVGSPKLSRILNDYSIVVQEYYQQRVEIWLNTVGKAIFGIKYYWVRYEFAPGRGQIHAHLLAITEDHTMYKYAHLLHEQGGEKGEKDRADFLAKWADKTFGLTASVGDGYDEREVTKEDTPVRIRFADLRNDDDAIYEDGQDLLKFVQHHKCDGFCLRKDEHG